MNLLGNPKGLHPPQWRWIALTLTIDPENTMTLEYLKEKLEEWKLTLNDEADYWDGVYCSDRGMYGGGAKDFLDWLEVNP